MRFNKSLLVLGLLAIGAFSALYAGDISRAARSTNTPIHSINPSSGGFATLYDQCTDTTEYDTFGTSAQNFETAFDAFDDECADDFVVPTGETWTVNEVIVLGFYSATGPVSSVNVTIWSNVGGLPGAVVYSAPSVVPTTDAGGSFVLDLSTPAMLSAGTYWLEAQANMDFGVGGQWYWFDNIVLHNSGAAWRNVGGGFGVGCTAWTNKNTCIGSTGPDQLFCILGSSTTAGVPCSAITSIAARCVGGGTKTVQARVNLLGSTIYAGMTVTIGIDEDVYVGTIVTNGVNSRANFSIAGVYTTGDHLITLLSPAGCGLGDKHATCAIADKADPAWDDDASWSAASTSAPQATKLLGNYPNPFNPTTNIQYSLGEETHVTLRVYNTLGQVVATLVNDVQGAGYKSVVWNGKNDSGASVASGLYIYTLTAGNVVKSDRMLFMK